MPISFRNRVHNSFFVNARFVARCWVELELNEASYIKRSLHYNINTYSQQESNQRSKTSKTTSSREIVIALSHQLSRSTLFYSKDLDLTLQFLKQIKICMLDSRVSIIVSSHFEIKERTKDEKTNANDDDVDFNDWSNAKFDIEL